MKIDSAELDDSFLPSADDFLVRDVARVENVEAVAGGFAPAKDLVQRLTQFPGLHDGGEGMQMLSF